MFYLHDGAKSFIINGKKYSISEVSENFRELAAEGLAGVCGVNMATWRILKTFSFSSSFSPLSSSRLLLKRQKLLSGRKYASSTPRKPVSVSEYCLDTIKTSEYENFLSLLLLPEQSRPAAIAIRAFNIELAQVPDVTSETLMARMRYQFWRDTLDQIYKGGSPNQPLALLLRRAIERSKLSKRWLKSMIDSREDQLENKQFSSVKAVEDYSEKSNSVLYYLILQSMGIENVHADHAASHIGKAEGLVKLLRGVPFLGAKRTVLLPRDIMMQHGVSQEEVVRGVRDQKVKDVIYDVASVAHQHIEHARSFMKDVPAEARVALLPSMAVFAYLKALQKADFDIFDGRLQKRNTWLPFSLWWAKVRKTY
ncbi:NADH dehydrogenase (ubiquinone) complex I, assembly factor 6-like [Penaeus japonicus]|uniref:NADH dehydrogenase (ubiquinone) complex I, assembly factor 6-like n=1 Tax=Penaeus japonicus TaxID=27405 RepID=UPI001C70D6CC|nr:NADH dehydrogenase (ubiquinone) complex I, assembly factor 6-like [Penaeus japonicus]